jgi:hypothetical protein
MSGITRSNCCEVAILVNQSLRRGRIRYQEHFGLWLKDRREGRLEDLPQVHALGGRGVYGSTRAVGMPEAN